MAALRFSILVECEVIDQIGSKMAVKNELAVLTALKLAFCKQNSPFFYTHPYLEGFKFPTSAQGRCFWVRSMTILTASISSFCSQCLFAWYFTPAL
ncbi:unnamed protein product [Linum trigynum]|uniref:Uncharacterized protein n=1 Tax=Linum trigynum TaxID=586398 RepID=A0AAV2FLY1_9ROSI